MIALNFIFSVLIGMSWAQTETPAEPVAEIPAEVPYDPVVEAEAELPSAEPTPVPAIGPTEFVPPKSTVKFPPPYRPTLIDRRTRRDPFFLGHLATPAISTLSKNQWTVGTMALGYGFTDEVMLAVSPWLMGLYNMNNVALRVRSKTNDPAWGFQGAYFKTNKSLGNVYKMEALGGWGLWRKRVTNTYRVIFSLNLFYFMDDEIPFSLRRWSLGSKDQEKSQWTFTTLHEMGTGGPFRLYVEAGVLGFTYSYPNYHFGASGAYRWKTGFVQFGLSATGYLAYLTRSAYNQVYTEFRDSSTAMVEFQSAYKNSVAVHPEVQVQFLF